MALKGFADIKTNSSSQQRDKFKVLNPKDYEGQEFIVRPVGSVYPQYIHWIKRRAKDGSTKTFPAPCANFNHKTNEFEDNGCPWCEAHCLGSRRYLMRVIDRTEVENEPKKIAPRVDSEKKKHTMDGIEGIHYLAEDSKSWTPVKVLSLPSGVAQEIGNLEKTKNSKVSKKTGKKVSFPAGDVKYGFDIAINYDSTKKSKAWSLDFYERTELTEEELNYLYPNFEDASFTKEVDVEKQLSEFKKIRDALLLPDGEELPETEEPVKNKSKKVDLADDDEDYDEEPKKKKRVVEDDDIDDDFDDDEEPKKKKKSKSYDDDEDDDEEEDDMDEEDLEDDSDDEEDDDDYVAPKKKKKSRSEEDDDLDGLEF